MGHHTIENAHIGGEMVYEPNKGASGQGCRLLRKRAQKGRAGHDKGQKEVLFSAVEVLCPQARHIVCVGLNLHHAGALSMVVIGRCCHKGSHARRRSQGRLRRCDVKHDIIIIIIITPPPPCAAAAALG